MKTRLIFCVAGAVLSVLATPQASASTVQLMDGGSVIRIDPLSQAGIFTWSVNGKNLMPQQWFWFRTGDSQELSIDSMDLDSATTDNLLMGDPGPVRANFLYSTSGMTLAVNLILLDSEPTRSLSEVLTWTNTSAGPINLTIFQYLNFQLSSGSDHLEITGNHTARQTGSGYTAEILVDPFDQRLVGFEAAAVPSTKGALNDATSTTFDSKSASASGNVSAAFQWQQQLPQNGSLHLSIIEHLTVSEIPEPGSAALVLGALAAILWARRRNFLHEVAAFRCKKRAMSVVISPR